MKKINSKTFCLFPYNHINLKANARVAICNRAAPMGKLDGSQSLSDFWKSDKVNELRQKQLKGVWPEECAACEHLEKSGASSYRTEALKDYHPFYKWDKEALEDGSFLSSQHKVREIELRFGNLCNLQCRMCGPKFSSLWEKEVRENTSFNDWIKSDQENSDIYDPKKLETKEQISLSNSEILKSLDDNIFDLRRVMISGGEPLIQKDHYILLEKLLPNAENITLIYSTNLNVLNFSQYDIIKLWKKFKKVMVKISIDADPVIYEYIRNGGHIKKVEANIRALQEVASDYNFIIMGTCTTSVYNIARLPKIMKYFASIGVLTHSSIVEYPDFLSSQVLPPGIKKSVCEDIQNFIENIEDQLPRHSFLSNQVDDQIQRTKRYTENCLNYTLGADQSEKWPQFLKFNSFFDKNNESLFSFYPEWQKHQ